MGMLIGEVGARGVQIGYLTHLLGRSTVSQTAQRAANAQRINQYYKLCSQMKWLWFMLICQLKAGTVAAKQRTLNSANANKSHAKDNMSSEQWARLRRRQSLLGYGSTFILSFGIGFCVLPATLPLHLSAASLIILCFAIAYFAATRSSSRKQQQKNKVNDANKQMSYAFAQHTHTHTQLQHIVVIYI